MYLLWDDIKDSSQRHPHLPVARRRRDLHPGRTRARPTPAATRGSPPTGRPPRRGSGWWRSTARPTNDDASDAAFTIVSPPGGTVPTTLRDFDMPGSQPFEGGPGTGSPQDCAACHGNYDPAVEPYRNWQGSMMAHASLDPLFEANMVDRQPGRAGLRRPLPALPRLARLAAGPLGAHRRQPDAAPRTRSASPATSATGWSIRSTSAGISPARDTEVLAALALPRHRIRQRHVRARSLGHPARPVHRRRRPAPVPRPRRSTARRPSAAPATT